MSSIVNEDEDEAVDGDDSEGDSDDQPPCTGVTPAASIAFRSMSVSTTDMEIAVEVLSST